MIADEFAKELDALCKKYNCEVGVWLTWRDLLHNLDILKRDPNVNELLFGLQIRIHEPDDKDKKGNKKPA